LTLAFGIGTKFFFVFFFFGPAFGSFVGAFAEVLVGSLLEDDSSSSCGAFSLAFAATDLALALVVADLGFVGATSATSAVRKGGGRGSGCGLTTV